MSRKNVEDLYPLSPLQQGLLFHSVYAPASGVYVEQLSCTLGGELNLDAFGRAWQQTIDRHPILRTAFVWEGLDEPVQVVRRSVRLPFAQEDWRALSAAEQQERLHAYLKDDLRQGFDLAKAPLMRIALLRLSEDSYQFVWSYHHLMLDGWCIPLVLREVFAFYEASSRGESFAPERPRPYRDYIAWLRRQDLHKAEAFWRQTLKGFHAPTPLPTVKAFDATDGEVGHEEYGEQEISLSADTTAALQTLARTHGLTLNTLVQGAWALLLGRYSGERDVVFGVTVAGRPAELAGVEAMVGLFINTLPLRVEVDGEQELLPWLKSLQEQQTELRQYEYSPLVQVQGWSDAPRGLPLFESLLVFENYPVDASFRQQLEQLSVTNIQKVERTNYPLNLLAVPGAQLLLRFSYDRRRFDAQTIERMLGHLQTALENFAAHPSRRLAAVPLLTNAERRQLLVEWNNTRRDYPQHVCLHELFEAQVERTPDAIAVVFEDERVSYGELNRRANALAERLRASGVGAETRVGVCAERSVEMVVALFAVLKAGGAYVPLEPTYPAERLSYMLADAQVSVLLTQERLLAALPPQHDAEIICLDRDWKEFDELNAENVPSGASAHNAAYVIYTSGSTGRPKGVVNTHGGICNRLLWMQDEYRLTGDDRVLQKTPYSFDVSVWEFFWPLLTGAQLVVARPGGHQDSAYLVRLIAREEITTLHFVPSMLSVFLSEPEIEACRSLRRVICSGEALTKELQERFYARLAAELHNLYGPTEAAIDVSYWACLRDDGERLAVPIGRPIANIQLYILDAELQPVPVGVAGELYIAGVGLARGYLNRPELTAEKFIANPFSVEAGARMYRTGDAARLLEGGEIEFLGRLDEQVKLRGFRIELGEIESVLAEHREVGECVVVAREDARGGERRIVAYFVPAGETLPTTDALRSFLREKLPEYMLPSAFVALSALPLTPNGKLDRRALPAPEPATATRDVRDEGARNPLEEVVAGIWAEVLGLDAVGVNDNFFEAGGHSLLALQVISRLRATLNIEVPVRELFDAPTVASFTERIETLRHEETGAPSIPLVPDTTDAERPLSFAQQRLWFLDQYEPESAAYNIPAAVRLSGALDVDALERSFNEVARRHEILRATFPAVQGQPRQVIAPVAQVTLRVEDLQHLAEDAREAEIRRRAAEEAVRPFSLSAGALFRVVLLKSGAREHVLLLTMHHIISDGWSIGILIREMAALYEAFAQGRPSPLAELPIQYADFARWQRLTLAGDAFDKQLAYWKARLGDAPPKLELPYKRNRTHGEAARTAATTARRSATYRFTLQPPLASALKSLSRREGTTLYMTLLAAYKTLLHHYTGAADISVGSPVANRNRAEVENLIGFFVNILILRSDLSGNPTFRELLARVRETTLGAYAHQDMPFEKLVEELPDARGAGHVPLHQVVFALQNFSLPPLALPELTLSQLDLEGQTAKNELLLFMNETEHGLEALVQYDADLFDAATVRRMFEHFEELLNAFAADPDRRIRSLNLFAREMADALALPAARVGRIAPLTPTQRDLYLAHLINPDTTVYSDGVSVALGANLDVAAWRKAVAFVFDSTEAARTRFFSYRGEPYQFVDLDYPVPFEFVDLADARGNNGDDATAAATDFARIVREKIKVKYDLDGGALLNNLLFRDACGQYVAAVAWYHILFDAYSLKLYLEGIVKTYLALVAGREPETGGRNSFYDYVGDSLARFDGKEISEFWSNKLSSVAPLTFPKGAAAGATGQSIARRLAVAPAHLARIRAFCDARDYSLPAYFRALYALPLGRSAAASDDFVVYELIGSRPREHADTIGCFYQVLPTLMPANLLAVATPVAAWFDYARHYRSSLGAMQNISVFQQTRIIKDEPLKFFYNFYNFSSLEIEGERKTISHYKSFPDDEVHFIVDDLHDAVELAFYYHANAFPDPRLLERILSLSEQVLDGAEILRALDPLLPAERERLLGEWNDTAREYTSAASASLHQLFEAQVERTPHAIAVVFKNERVSYAELNRRADRLAQRLRAAGVRAETRVGILAERSVEMVVGLLGILKAGGAYVPIDASYPAERVRFILEDAAVRVLLAQERLLDLLPAHGAEVIQLDVDWSKADGHGAENVAVVVSPHNAAYVIYTSGSTGRPKGVVNTHRGICNRLLWMQDEYRLTRDDRVLQKTPYSFDVSVWEFFWPLITGAQLIIAEPGGHQDAAYLVRLIAEQKITVTHFVPAMLRVFLEQRGVEACASLRDVICSGEALAYELQERFFALLSHARLHNLYGPTEAAVDVTYWACERGSVERIVPIGRPIANTQIHVLDRDLWPVPPGLAGELYIGGAGLARGYHRRPDLTAERFTPDPFAAAPGARLYRTGDLARRLPNGAIEYLGRTDFQVKVRGFRIELGEIEAALMNHPAIGEAVVVAKGDAELERHLVAYYTVAAAAAETQPAEAALRAHLKETLPDYMLPSAFVALDALPLTPNGKVDRRALPEPEQGGETPEREVTLARTPFEQTLAGIWGEVLKRERVSVYDNFFDVGGHSLLATQIVARASEAFEIELPLRSLFESPTVAELAARIETTLAAHEDVGKRLPPILPVDRSIELPLSFAQQRLWFLDQFEPGSPFYNIPSAVRLSGTLDVDALEHSLNEVVRRHEILRTTFESTQGQPRQVIAPVLKLSLARENLQHLNESERRAEVQRLAVEESQRSFDLATAPLVRARLLQVADDEHVLLFTMHHIISDGWSVNVLLGEVAALYEAYMRGERSPLAELSIQYADFAAWQRAWLDGEQLDAQLRYWHEQLRDAPALLELPTDRPRQPVQTYRGATARFTLPKNLSQALQRLSRREGATLFMTLLAAFQSLLQRYSGANDVVVGTPIAGRNRAEIEGLIGFFVNTLVLRATFDGDPSFVELLARVREVCLGAYAHQDVPFEKLVEELQPEREMSHTPLFQVMFALQNAVAPTQLPGLELSSLEVESGVAKFDLTLGMNETDEGLGGLFEYNTDLFEGETIERMIGHLTTLLEAIVADPQRRVSELPLMAERERRQIVCEWNETAREYVRGECVHEMFEQQALERPEAVALVCEGKGWTFAEVNARANKLARYLRRRGVGAEDLVGVLMERSAEMFIGLLGVLKAGAAYLPLDPTYPKERLAFILQDARIALLLTEERLRQTTFEHTTAHVVCVDAAREEVARESVENLEGNASADNLVYVIYTSGSTGRPKGVCVTHGALANNARAMSEHYGLQPDDRVLQFASMSFDVAAEELFATWARGAAVVVMPPDDYLLQTFIKIIEEQRISAVYPPASYWYEWVAALSRREAALPPHLRLVVTGNEKVSTAQFTTWHALVGERVRWINAYGPTEATITTTIFEPQGELKNKSVGSVPIGRPINNARVYLLDKKLQPVPVGIAGELHIGGAGVARGYLDRPELTAEKFIPDPFGAEAGARLYRTGDWARYLPDGQIEFLRRMDQQVKVRGFRIELGEIESALTAHAGVHETAVVVREDAPEDKRIVAYVVPKREGGGEASADVELWPSLGEYQVYDELMYFAMTNDEQRTGKYEEAIKRLVRDKMVVEIGTGGEAILARLCVAAGATKVYAIEALDDAREAAESLIKSLGLSDKIILLGGYSFDVQLLEKVDVCVSELIGTIGGSEGTIAILNDAAARFLKDDGQMIPRRCITKIAAAQLPEVVSERPRFTELSIGYTERIFERVGHKFDVRVCVRNFPQENLLSDAGVFEDLDFGGYVAPDYAREITLKIAKKGRLDGFLLWLNLHTTGDVVIDNLARESSWLPVYFPVFHPGVEVDEGDIIRAVCSASLSDNGVNPDYKIAGTLVRRDGEVVPFAHSSPHHAEGYGQTEFYRRLFSNQPATQPRGGTHDITAEKLRAYLAERVPAYMLPSAFVLLDEMPLTPSGKLDARALPAPETLRPELSASYAVPRSPVEEVLAGIFCEVLKLERVGTGDNFFALGGHSLLATQVVARAREVFGVELPLRALFETPTVAGLAAQVEALAASGQMADAPPPLRPVPRDGDLPLSFIQQRFWFLHQLMPESSAYNIPTAVRLKGALDVAALERSFNEVVRRHEILRTRFVSNGGRPEQLIASELKLEFPLIDLSDRAPKEREAEARRLAAEEAQRPFDLARAPLIRITLLRLDADEFILLFTMHHIVSDGWSAGVLIRDLTAIYEAYAAGLPSPLPELPIQFADFAHWQREWLQGDALEHRLSYWRRQFGDGLPVLNLPTDKPRPPVPTDHGALQTLVLPAHLGAAIESLAQHKSATLFMTLLAAFKVLLHRYTGQDDILVGSSIANRNHVETEGLIGLLINTLILRTDLSGDPTFGELLARVREASLGAYAHQDLPFEQLLEELRADFDAAMGNAPVFQVAFQLQNFSMPTLELKNLTLSPFDVEGQTAKFDLSLSMIERPDGLVASLEYNTDLFEAATIRRMLEHYRTLLEGIVAAPERRISALPMLGEAEQRQLLSEWNPAFESDAPAACLHHLFEAQAKRRPDRIALVFEDQQLTYGELNRRANKLAHYLRRKGVGADTLVAICVERSFEMLVGILGILKAGGAYVPLDPAYPKERLAFILEDTQARLLLTQESLREILPEHDSSVVLLDADWREIADTSSDENLGEVATADALAYVIYTSGSTGRPKGVLVSHENVARLLEATQAHFEFDESDVWTLFHSYAFDFSVWEIWGALAHGGKLIVVPYWVSRSAEAFRRLLASEHVTVLNQTPSAFRQLAAADEAADVRARLKLRFVIFGGEALELQSLRSWFERHGDRTPQLVNMFGITETTVHVTYRPLTVADLELASGSVIGRPLECLQVYLLDGRGQPVPVGVPAEICVGGTGVARGYLNRAELTAERFVPHPFADEPGARLYRSGDLARRLPDGDIEYLGRIDNQVKVRGFRIELGEIESAFAEHEGVRECTVVANSDANGETKLLAYLVGGGQQPAPSTTELREFLQAKLPEHMIPAAFIALDAMPLTPNGKIDRRALPAPDQSRPQLGREFVAPRTPVEQELAKIWRELLGVEEVGIYDDFFELGGHSLLLTQLASWIRKDFQVEVPLRVLFDTPTITDMTKAILARQVEQETQTDLAEMLSQLKQLSPHEVKAMLEKMGGSS
ncbi:MAG TPA: non-ribosomal peptide synthase/polyketide synthase [Pyrinomonadaceae bacterium]|nr:non-ribosomal peptide synthase/polyketide synthase [Pyrinomonadaceae bacterium]